MSFNDICAKLCVEYLTDFLSIGTGCGLRGDPRMMAE